MSCHLSSSEFFWKWCGPGKSRPEIHPYPNLEARGNDINYREATAANFFKGYRLIGRPSRSTGHYRFKSGYPCNERKQPFNNLYLSSSQKPQNACYRKVPPPPLPRHLCTIGHASYSVFLCSHRETRLLNAGYNL